ncbi:cytochrome P450 [Suillus subalutaceus]|uniref:cytochrome P450 n=1 Tax=Suillus subalutaceus TaxID=48586 RepID=UPI001B85D174|nr:cytochrome P450 [Suillus subalutaceus]KAG1831214.1 cytochrome P450 [Suillus subalutaceus]
MQLVLSAAVCLAVAGVIFWASRPKSKSGLPLPPSPPTWKLGGHVLPPRRPFLTIAGWIDEYGPLITIRLKFERIVISAVTKSVLTRCDIISWLKDVPLQAAVEIMENQGKFLADRPPMIAAGELFSGGMSIAFMPFVDRFRRMRRALHSHLQPKAAEAYQPLQMSHAKDIVLGVLDNPHNLRHHVITFAAATIMKIAYGKNTLTSATDPEVIEMQQIVRVTTEIMRPAGVERSKKFYLDQLNRVKEQMQSDVDIGPSFTKNMLEDSQSYGLTETEMAFLGGAFFGAGSDTTSRSICTVLMAAACFPEEQAKVQAELDAVIGRHRAPTFADKGSLPRLQAFISEALRWRPVASGGVTIFTLQDWLTAQPKTWFGQAIFEQAIAQMMIWPIRKITVFQLGLRCSATIDVYPEPYAFKPQRWIDDEGGLRDDLKFFVYGFGRRVCPGQHVVDRSVFIITLLILWAYKLTLDPTKPLEDMEFMDGLMPDVLSCTFEFEKRIPETELRSMMQYYPEVA